MYRKYVKRIFDIIVACIIMLFSAIPMLIIAIAIKIEDRGPIIYKSERIGKGLKTFDTYKFRSMKTDREELNSDMSHEEMVTKVGKFIRKTSLDELPQIFNVLKGDMSFIGPRPWIPEYYDWFSKEQKRRADVLPGISGLALVKGRNGIDIFKKVEYDIEYVDNISLWMDIKCIWFTIAVVFKKDNAEISEIGIKEEIEDLKRRNSLEKAV